MSIESSTSNTKPQDALKALEEARKKFDALLTIADETGSIPEGFSEMQKQLVNNMNECEPMLGRFFGRVIRGFGENISGFRTSIHAFAPLADGSILIAADEGTLKIFSPANHSFSGAIPGLDEGEVITALLSLPDGTVLVGSASATLRIFNSIDHVFSEPIVGFGASVYSLCALPDGTILVGGENDTLKIFTISERTFSENIPGTRSKNAISGRVRSLVPLLDGTILVSGIGTAYRTFNPLTKSILQVFNNPFQSDSVAYSLSDGTVLTGGYGGSLAKFDPQKKSIPKIAERFTKIESNFGSKERICAFQEMGDGNVLVGGSNGTLKILSRTFDPHALPEVQ